MTKRGTCFTAGAALGVVAVVALAALFEHWAPRKSDEWLQNIFPFGLATSTTSLLVIAVSALVGAWLFLRSARAE